MSEQEFQKILAGCKQGDQEAWSLFMDEFHPLITGTVKKVFSYYNDDVVQMVYEKLIKNQYEKLKQFQGSFEKFLVYLQNFTKNIAMQERRTQWRKLRNEMLTNMFTESEAVCTKTAEENFFEQEMIFALYICISRLKPIYRKIILMLLDGYKYKEIAEQLGIPLNTCITRGNRAKQILRRMLENLK